MKGDEVIGKLMDLNLNIVRNYFGITTFVDIVIEKLFQEYRIKEAQIQKIIINIFLVLGYISFYIFLFMAFYRLLFVITCSIIFVLALMSMIINHFIKNNKFLIFNNYLQITLSSINLIIKGILICVYFNTKENDNNEELIRIIIYEFISTNLLISFILEADVRVYLYFFLQNTALVIVCIIYANQDRHYIYDAIISFFVAFTFFMIRKQWDYNIRLIFSEKMKFQIYFNYAFDFLNGLNCYNINIKKNKVIYYKDNLTSLFDMLKEKGFISRPRIPSFDEESPSKNNKKINPVEKNLGDYDILINEMEKENSFKLENLDENSQLLIIKNNFLEFLKNLKFFEKNQIEALKMPHNNGLIKDYNDKMEKENLEEGKMENHEKLKNHLNKKLTLLNCENSNFLEFKDYNNIDHKICRDQKHFNDFGILL